MEKISHLAVVQTTDIGEDVRIAEFAVVRASVKIGRNVIIHPHVVINSGVILHDGVEVFPGAVIGRELNGSAALARVSHFEKHVAIGANSSIGPHTIIYYGVEIGADTIIDGHCEIGYPTLLTEGQPLIIGQGSLIRSNSIFYGGSTFGCRLVTGHRVTVREKTIAGENLEVGTLCDIQGDCIIGDFVRFHSSVHVGKKSQIGNYVRLYPYVVLTNDPTPPSETLIGPVIEDYAIVATMSVILPGIIVGRHTLIGAHSLVSKNVPEGMVVGGVPAKILGAASNIKLRDGSGQPAYPWTAHFHRGYPKEIIKEWNKALGTQVT